MSLILNWIIIAFLPSVFAVAWLVWQADETAEMSTRENSWSIE